MKNYQLKSSEVVLFKNDVILFLEEKKSKIELLLTNENFVFINKSVKFLQTKPFDTIIVPIESIKIYNKMPYIVKKKEFIEIYSLNGEFGLEFENKKLANEFFNKAMRVASGYSKFVRGIKIASKEIKDTNDALDITNTTQKALDFAADVAIDFADQPKKNKIQLIGSVAKAFKKHNKQKDLQIEHNSPRPEIEYVTADEIDTNK